jgi:WD40 repeat protein
MRLHTLGGLSLEGSDFRRPKPLLLLAYLALEGAKPRYHLAELFFMDTNDRLNSLSRALSYLRQEVPGVIESDNKRVWATVSCDAVELLNQTDSKQFEKCLELYKGAFAIDYDLELSEELEEWVYSTREILAARARQAFLTLGEAEASKGDFSQAAFLAEKAYRLKEATELEPDDFTRLYNLLYAGNSPLAAEVRKEAESFEIPLELSREEVKARLTTTDELPKSLSSNPYQGLLAFREAESHFFFGRERVLESLIPRVAKNSLQVVVGASGSGKSSVVFAGLVPHFRKQGWRIEDFRPGRNPYRNLAHALLRLQGRAQPDSEAISRLGASLESGKTKLLDVVDDTFQQSPNASLLLIADQFEELFTISESEASATTATSKNFDTHLFMDQLLASTTHNQEHFHLVLTLRADFLGSLSSHRAFADALNHEHTLYTLGPMTSEELQQAIEHPAERQGAVLEEGLSERILQDVVRQEGSLPLLEFALSELWVRQDNGALTHNAYDRIGGVEGALAKHAEETFSKLKANEQSLAQKVFLQLVYPGAGQEDTRRVASYQELKDAWSVVNKLADKRLLVTNESEGQQTAEVIHEALIRRWGTLRGWINQHRAFRIWQERLRQDVKLWRDTNQARDTLLIGYRLDEALKMRSDYDDLLLEEERSYIDDGLKQREREEADRKAQEQRELEREQRLREEQQLRQHAEEERLKRQVADEKKLRETEQLGRRRTRRWLNVALVFLGVSLVAALYAFNRQAVADRETAKAERAAQLAQAGELVAMGQVEFEDRPLLGLYLALEGLMSLPGGEETRLEDVRRTTINLAKQGRLLKLGDDVEAIYAPENPVWFIVDYATKLGELRSFSNGKVVTTLASEVEYVTYSPDGKWFVVNYTLSPGDLGDVADPGKRIPLSGDLDVAYFSPDGKWLVLDYSDAPAELRELAKPETFTSLDVDIDGQTVYSSSNDIRYEFYQRGVTFSPDSKWFVVDNFDGPAELREVAKPDTAHPLSASLTSDFGEDVTFSPDSKWFAVDYRNVPAELREVAKPDAAYPLSGTVNIDSSESITFSPDSRWIVMNYGDAPAELRELARPETKYLLSGTLNNSIFSRSVNFSPDSTWLAVDYRDAPDELRSLAAPGTTTSLSGAVASITPSPDGQWLVVDFVDAPAELRELAKPQTPLAVLSGDIVYVIFSSDSKAFMVNYENATFELREVARPGIKYPLSGSVTDVFYSPDSKWFVVNYFEAPGELRDTPAELREVAEPDTKYLLTGTVNNNFERGVTFSPDSKWFVTHYLGASSELRAVSQPEIATQLGLALADVTFDASNQRLLLFYSDGRSYLLDLEWIEAMAGRDDLSIEELVRLACDGPLQLNQVTVQELPEFLVGNESVLCK